MSYFYRSVWALVILINLSAIIWFILGTTANFNRGIDLIPAVILGYIGGPSILLILLSLLFLLTGWLPSSAKGIVSFALVIISLLVFSLILYKNVDRSGWLEEHVRTDSLQVTSDHLYEYHIELINLSRRDSHARLYLKKTSTEEEIRIPLDMSLKDVAVLFIEETNYWIVLDPTSEEDTYILETTKTFPIKGLKYKIDVKKREAVRLGSVVSE